MKCRFLFEFMDQTWAPNSLRLTLREILEIALAKPFRSYYAGVAEKVQHAINGEEKVSVVELGAGTAPITQHLAKLSDLPHDLELIACDLNPDHSTYEVLEKQYPGLVKTIREPVDFSKPLPFDEKSLLVLSATFHHIPPSRRQSVIREISQYHAIIVEPISRSWSSVLLALLNWIPALWLPLRLRGCEPGFLRRMFWCWILPAAPLAIVWDGIVSALRCWSVEEWKETLTSILPQDRPCEVKITPVGQLVSW
jgi:SAM-dependent methyltransferase